MILKETILSAFNERGTLLKWLKKVEKLITEKVLVKPVNNPQSTEIVAVNSTGEQAMLEVGTGLTIDNGVLKFANVYDGTVVIKSNNGVNEDNSGVWLFNKIINPNSDGSLYTFDNIEYYWTKDGEKIVGNKIMISNETIPNMVDGIGIQIYLCYGEETGYRMGYYPISGNYPIHKDYGWDGTIDVVSSSNTFFDEWLKSVANKVVNE